MNNFWLLLILIVPISWPWISKIIWPYDIKYWEVLIHILVVIIVTTGIWFLGMYGQTRDIEVWNGQVVKKERLKVSCDHSYECNCRTVSCGKDCTTTQCDTCYEHSYDIDWRVYSNIDDYENINRIDRQGLKEPSRWTSVKIGEPYSDSKSFVNYIKGAPSSLFNNQSLATKYKKYIPKYPNNIYDYYKNNHVITSGTSIPDLNQWNKDVAKILIRLGPNKKSNIVIVFAKQTNVEFAKALKESWLGGKKNDTVIVIGSVNYPDITFVDVFSWSKKGILNVELRDRLLNVGKIDRSKMIPIIEDEIWKNFKKRSMEEYEYLKDSIIPPLWMILSIAGISLAISVGITYYTINNEY